MKAPKHEARVAKYPLLPLRGLTVFPQTTRHLDVGRDKSVKALEDAVNTDQCLFLVAQKDMTVEDPGADDLNGVGVVCRIRQVLKLPSGTVRLMVEGLYRARLCTFSQCDPFVIAEVKECLPHPIADTVRERAYVRECRNLFNRYVALAGEVPEEVSLAIASEKHAGRLTSLITDQIPASSEEKQPVLEALTDEKQIRVLLKLLSEELELLKLQQGIEEKVQKAVDKNQKDYYLHEQMKAIADELGEKDNPSEEADELRAQVKQRGLPEEVRKKLLKECDKLAKMPFGSHETTVVSGYLDTCLGLPWGVYSTERRNITAAEKILNRDHYGLKKVKERILELLAVHQLTDGTKGQILCLVGPPGVGKTSIARSVAEALGREYVRVSLGGVRDEAEIRGHRKTYIGSMPGRIIQGIARAKTMNPVMLLDEIDKLGSSYNGDPSSALLEVLDAEQNRTFRDHYLEVPFDLSRVLFITTANTAEDIPEPLFDRMDVITLSSYTAEEKYQIARRFLLTKQLRETGLTASELSVHSDALHLIIDGYTREGGVRQLQRCLATICRKSAQLIVSHSAEKVTVTAANLKTYLGPRRYKDNPIDIKDEVGVVTGLAWTAVGGETMPVEVAILDGTGKIELTGSLGDVMKESAYTAISYVRSRTERWHIEKDFYKTKDIHIHVPEGAVPKDGPSAGVTMATAMISALTGIPVRHDVAMTGEISLRGRVLPIGGLKEKTMAAYRHHFHTVVIPEGNESDLDELDETVKKHLCFVTAKVLDTVVETALVPQ